MQTALKLRLPLALVVDADDALLLKLLESVRFPIPNEWVDLSVECKRIICSLNRDYALRENKSRAARYPGQVRDFLATLPSYLKSARRRNWQPALAFPQMPARWSGTVKLGDLQELRSRIRERKQISVRSG
jgi:hypothetical protein